MSFVQRALHSMVLQMDHEPKCLTEGKATDWEPFFCWLPTRLFNVWDGFGRWVWLIRAERRMCKTAEWLHPGPAYWVEYRAPTTNTLRKKL